MFKGFYNLTSGMLSQGRRLDVVANNMTNVATSGYKSERYTDSTFREYVISRVGNRDKSSAAELGGASYALAPSRLYTDYSQGALEETGMGLDFAISGEGFFAVQSAQGTAYTRSGSFSLDGEGYLCLPGEGRVLDLAGEPIRLLTDKIRADGYGALYTEDGGYLGQIGVYLPEDREGMEQGARGLFTGGGQMQAAAAPIHWQALERSNVDLVQQMVEMITSQRALQSAAQMSKMYDQLMTKAASELGRV